MKSFFLPEAQESPLEISTLHPCTVWFRLGECCIGDEFPWHMQYFKSELREQRWKCKERKIYKLRPKSWQNLKWERINWVTDNVSNRRISIRKRRRFFLKGRQVWVWMCDLEILEITQLENENGRLKPGNKD